MISGRVADNSLGAIKDDLLLALQRIQLDLESYREDPAETASLEAILDAIDQIRGPLAVLDHREAVALLEAMHALTVDWIAHPGAAQPDLLAQAAERLDAYLSGALSPGQRRTEVELSKLIEALRQAHSQHSSVAAGARSNGGGVLPVLEQALQDLRQAVAEHLEGHAEHPVAWEHFRHQARAFTAQLGERNGADVRERLNRLDRVAAQLAEGSAAEVYGPLAAEVCAEILAGVGHCLAPLAAGEPAPENILVAADEQLNRMETLLKHPTVAPAALSRTTVLPAPESIGCLPENFQDMGIELPEFDFDMHPPAPESYSSRVDQVAPAAPRPAPPPASVPSLIDMIGLTEADPEFIEVFLEEAQGELVTIRDNLAIWRSDLEDRAALTTIRRAFHTLKGSGRMVGAMVIGDFAWEFENLLNQVLNAELHPSMAIADAVAAAVEALSPLVGETPLHGTELEVLPLLVARVRSLPQTVEAEPEPSVAPMLPSLVPGLDPEFLDVFLEEARGEVAAIHEQLPVWRQRPEDRAVLSIIRRAFHTLKGSGRVVGATLIGDLAGEFETLVNAVLSGTVPASADVTGLIAEAAQALDVLLGSEPVHEEIGALTQRLSRRAIDLRSSPPVIEHLEPAAPLPKPPEPVAETPPVVAAPRVIALPLPEPEPVAPPVPAPSMEMASAQLASIDPELAQVFQYEAAEILDGSDALLQRLGSEPDSTVLLNDLRRGMHTLKGSSRLTGFMVIGDLAHAAESVLDALGKNAVPVTPVILETLQNTLDRLNRMLAEAGGGSYPAPATDLMQDLLRLADAVGSGQAIESLPSPVVPVEAAATAVPETAPVAAMTELDQELVQVFQSEAAEILDSSDVILQRLAVEPDNSELLNNLRREMHTLKGSSRLAGFMSVGDLAHAAESVLDALGKGTLSNTPPVLEQLQLALDRLHRMLVGVREGVQPPPQTEQIEALHALLGGKPQERIKPVAAVVAAAATAMASAAAAPKAAVGVEAPAAADAIRVSAALLNSLVNQMGESSIFRARIDQGVGAMSNHLGEFEQTISRLRRQVTHLATQAEARIQSRQDYSTKAHQQEFDPLELDRFTELQQLSRSLMEIADDLSNIGNTLGEHARDITTLLDQQAKVNKEIQQGLMRTGMVRFGSIIPRLRRVVRQSAQELGKRAELLVGGEEAEVDRTVLENMLAPLEHMLRNSLAHGIETPEQRRAAGKSDIGTISLSLRREGAELVLELGDDGGGLHLDAIRRKGEEKGLIEPGQVISQDELIALLLRPGFSTATTVTQISGRGVGMDVVNAAIRAMRGALLIQTESGQGTRFVIRLPFSLSVTQALLVKAGESIFAIPLLSIELVTRLREEHFKAYLAGEQIQHTHNDRRYPVHNLGILIGSEHIVPFEEVGDRRPPTLLFRSAEASAALQVEQVLGNQEIIVKPVGPQFNGVPGISGATVLGDGRVVVVLELAALVRNIGSQLQKQAESRALRVARQESRPEKLTVMVIDDSITMRKVTARILERHNIEVVTAKDGMDAVALLQNQVPDLAILDIEMPRMDGFEVIAHVRNQPLLQHLPIIMVTSRGGEKHRERAIRLGVNDYLTKPYQEEQLMQSIRKILGERALELIT